MDRSARARTRSEAPGALTRPRVLLVVALAALLVRIGYEVTVARDTGPLGTVSHVLMGDERAYDALARSVADGSLHRTRAFYQEPLYGWVVGQVYRAFPPAPLPPDAKVVVAGSVHRAIFLAQHGLGIVTALVVALLAMRCFSLRAGLLAGLFAALSGPLVFHEGMLLKEPVAVLSIAVTLHLWLDVLQQGGRLRACVLGVVLGLGILLRGNLYFLLALVVVSLVFRRRFVETALTTACALVALSPATIHNLRRSDPVLTTYQAGSNAAIGQPDDDSIAGAALYTPLRDGRGDALYEETDAVALAEDATGRPMKGHEISAWWWDVALDRMARRPLVAVQRALLKAAYTFHGDEAPDVKDWRFAADGLPWLSTPLSDFRVLGPLALAGFLLLPWRRRDDLFVVRGCVVITIVSLALFYVMGRYRLPAAPGLWVLAAGLLDMAPRWRGARAVVAGVVSVALVGLAQIPLREGASGMQGAWTNYATAELSLAGMETDAAAAARHRDKAVAAARRVLETAPEFVDARAALVNALDLQTKVLGPRPEEAWDEAWRLLLVAHGTRVGTDVRAEVAGPLDRVQEAVLTLREREAAPGGERSSSALASAALRVAVDMRAPGDQDLALALLDDALAADPALAQANMVRGQVLKRLGRLADAEASYRRALAAGLDGFELHNNLGSVLLALNRPAEALAAFEKALERAPDQPLIRSNIEKARTATDK